MESIVSSNERKTLMLTHKGRHMSNMTALSNLNSEKITDITAIISSEAQINMTASSTVTPDNNCNAVASSNINSENVIDMAAISASEAEIYPNLRKEMDLIQHLLI